MYIKLKRKCNKFLNFYAEPQCANTLIEHEVVCYHLPKCTYIELLMWFSRYRYSAGLGGGVLSSACQEMVSLDTHQACSPAEDLLANVWRKGTWNVRSMVDTECPIKVAGRRGERGIKD